MTAKLWAVALFGVLALVAGYTLIGLGVAGLFRG